MNPTPSGNAAEAAAYRSAIGGCIGTLVGIVASGPLAVALVESTHPQPPWNGAELFARSFHLLQILPYAGGLLLVLSLLILLSSLQALLLPRDHVRASLAWLASAVFACFILLNYSLQTAYLPALARSYQPGDGALLTALSMSNPESLAWALEMWGWGCCGVATWLLAGVFDSTAIERATRGLERATRACCIANGLVSVTGTAWTVIRPGWVMTLPGLIAFVLWNVLLAALAVLALVSVRRRLASLPKAARSDGTASP